MLSQFSLSLKGRQILVFFSIIVVVIPAVFFSIEQAFKQSQIKALEQQLEANLYSIVAEIDMDAQDFTISEAYLPPMLNQVGSGTIAVIKQDQQRVWRSDSALNQSTIDLPPSPQPGTPRFGFTNQHWYYSFALFYEFDEGTRNLVVHMLQHETVLDAQMQSFHQIIVRWFFAIAVVLILALAFGLWSTLAPINKLDEQIKLVEKGQAQTINGDFPKELSRVKEDLNLLINAHERQKNRYRSYLSDLTHALKTPVAVLRSSPVCDTPAISEQLDRMTNIIEHQLRKAASGGEDVWKKKIAFNPVVDKLIGVMTKIYAEKAIKFSHQLDQDYYFYGDEADLMEILGNLIDNACKACKSQVKVSLDNANPLVLVVEDDGPGIKPSQREQLLVRGQRLDTYSQGHGVGMAIVNDLVNSYQAKMLIEDSALGGAKFVVHFSHIS